MIIVFDWFYDFIVPCTVSENISKSKLITSSENSYFDRLDSLGNGNSMPSWSKLVISSSDILQRIMFGSYE